MVKPLFKVITIEESLNIIEKTFDVNLFLKKRKEILKILDANNRILAVDVISDENIPGFNRSTMDGYAVKSFDTFGASDSLPAYLEIAGEIKMSEEPSFILKTGQAARISTGGMLPKGADAVVMLEYADSVDSNMVEIIRSVASWENVLKEDEDIKKGDILLKKGHCLRPQDIGLMAAMGCEKIKVYRKPVIAIISTGDEIIPVDSKPKAGQVRNINSYTLGSYVEQLGCIPNYLGIVKDDEFILEKKLAICLENQNIDMILISGGSSVGTRDYTLEVLNRLGPPGILVHGLALKPGKPTIISINKQKIFIGLPGHPVSAMMVFENVVRKIIFSLKGENFIDYKGRKTINAYLKSNVFSDAGREEYISVRLKEKRNKIWAIPILGKSGMISSLSKADGYIKIGLNQEGLYQGEKVTVTIF